MVLDRGCAAHVLVGALLLGRRHGVGAVAERSGFGMWRMNANNINSILDIHFLSMKYPNIEHHRIAFRSFSDTVSCFFAFYPKPPLFAAKTPPPPFNGRKRRAVVGS